MRLLQQLYRDESGVVISAELVIVSTVGVMALVVGWDAVATILAQELGDVANAMGALDQSYNYRGLNAFPHARCSGSGYNDNQTSVTIDAEGNVDIGGFQLQRQDVAIPVVEEPLVEVTEVEVIELTAEEIATLTHTLIAEGYSESQATILVTALVDGLITVDELQFAINVLAEQELTDDELRRLIGLLESEEVTSETEIRALIRQAKQAASTDPGASAREESDKARQCKDLQKQIELLEEKLKALKRDSE